MSMSNEKLRLYAVRAIRAVEDNKQGHPMIAEFEPVLVPAAAKFAEAFDAHRTFTPERASRMNTRHDKCKELHGLMRKWRGPLAMAIPAYETNRLLGSATDPDQTIADAQRLLSLLNEHGERLVHREVLVAQLTEVLAAATEERVASLRVLKEHNMLEARLTAMHDDLLRVINLLRETLLQVLGPNHVDYKALTLRAKPKKATAADPQPEETTPSVTAPEKEDKAA